MKPYIIQGQKKALALPNRGPIRFDENADIHPDTLKSYLKYGFYIFENALGKDGLQLGQAQRADALCQGYSYGNCVDTT